MRKIHIFNESHTLEVEILPDFGAVISGIRFHGRRVLWFDEEMLGLGNVLAGGIPVLFPFAGKTRQDALYADERAYGMPMHGLVKDRPFDVELVRDDEVILTYASDARTERLCYPYPFTLRMHYRAHGDCLHTTAEVLNRGAAGAMPVAMGYHPYFYTSDKADTCLEFAGGAYEDYVECGLNGEPVRGSLQGEARVEDAYDHVFTEVGRADFRFVNRKDGYGLNLTADDTFRVLTLSTRHVDSVCIEPWQGKSNAANTPAEQQLIPAGSSRKFSYDMRYFLIP